MRDMSAVTKEEFLAAAEPSGPAPVSLFTMLRGGWNPDPLARWTKIRAEHGDVARYRIGFSDIHLVSHPDGVKRVLQDHAANYTKRHSSYAMLRRVVGNGLITSEGSFWLRQRRLAQPAFHREKIAAMAAQISRAAQETGDRWSALTGPASMLHEMSKLTLRVVGDALFGTSLPAEAAQLGEAWDVLNTQMSERTARARMIPPILPTAYDRAFRRAHATMFRVVDSVIAARRRSGADSAELLSMLMAATDVEGGGGMTDAQLRDEVVTMVVAGHETTAVTLAWTWALLDQHPAVRARLTDELRAVLGGRLPGADDVPKLTYTRAVIDEAMRVRPPVYILFRRVVDDDVVCGKRVRKGSVVVISPMVVHRHPAFWPAPDAFDPGRWLAPDPQRPRFAFLPFGGGPRQCIGNTFATMEAVLILATLAQRFAPRVAGPPPVPEFLLTLRPKDGLPMTLVTAP